MKLPIIIVVVLLLLLVGIYFFRRPRPPVVLSTPEVARTPPPAQAAAPVLADTTIAQPHATPVAAPAAPASPVEYWLYVRAWTRDGRPAGGAEVEFMRVFPGSAEVEVDSEPLPSLRLDDAGEGAQKFPASAQYAALCRAEGLAAYELFSFGRDTVVHLDLVLQPAMEITGRAVDTSGKGVPGVSVAALVQGRVVGKVVGDDEGNFHFDRPMPERCLVRGEAEGYATAVSAPVRAGEVVKLVMTKGAQLVATVRDRIAHAPVRDFSLELKGDRQSGLPSYSGTTDASGVVNLAALAPGEYRLRSADPARVLTPADSNVSLKLGETTRLDLFVDTSATVEGLVLDGDTRAGIPNVSVFVNFAETPMFDSGRNITGADGTFAIPGLPAGAGWVRIMGVPTQYSQGQEFAVVAQKNIQTEAGGSVKDVVFELHAGVALRGRVINKDGTPAPGADVMARVPIPDGPPNGVSWAVETVTDAQGEFAIYKAPEDASLFFRAKLRGRTSDEVGPVDAATQTPVVLTLNDAATGTLAGQLLDREGKPMKGHVTALAQVPDSLYSGTHRYTTEEDGYFLLTDVTAGTYDFQFGPYKGGLVEYIDSGGPVTLAAGQSINDIRLQLAPAGPSISGVVRKSTGELVPNYMIEVEGIGASEVYAPFTTVMTDETGAFIIENIAEGTYRLHQANSDLGEWRIQAEAGETVEVVLPGKDAPPPVRIVNGVPMPRDAQGE